MKTSKWFVEKDNIVSLAKSGKTLQEIGNTYGVSREMIRQVLKKYFPELTKAGRGVQVRLLAKNEQAKKAFFDRTNRETWLFKNDIERAQSQCFIRKKQNAKRGKWEWELEKRDVTFPEFCPILGIKLDYLAEVRSDNSPSFDRIDNTKGYLPGNVIVCSWRANRIKNDGTAEEHSKIASYLNNLDKSKQKQN